MNSGNVLQFVPDREDAPLFLDTPDVARKLSPDMPVFCYSAATLRARAALFIQGFPGEVSYAVKANASPHVLATLSEAGIAIWDVASLEEMRAVRSISRSACFHYHNPVKSRAEIREAYVRFDCRRFAVDCREELDKISEVVGRSGEIEIAVRFVLKREAGASAHDFSSKFGADESEAVDLLREAAMRGYRVVLTFHPGSQCRSPAAYDRHIIAAHRKMVRRGTEIFINDGIYGALLECAQVPELMPRVRVLRSGKPLCGSECEYTIYGPTCDPLDVLPGRLKLPAGLSEGDYLEFFSLGAYGAATATRFNGYGTRDVVPVASWIPSA